MLDEHAPLEVMTREQLLHLDERQLQQESAEEVGCRNTPRIGG